MKCLPIPRKDRRKGEGRRKEVSINRKVRRKEKGRAEGGNHTVKLMFIHMDKDVANIVIITPFP